MSDEKKSNEIVTPYFRVSFPAVFKAKQVGGQGEFKFSIGMLFPKTTDLSAIKALIKAAVEEKWGTDPSKWPTKIVDGKKVSAIRMPLRDGSEKDYEGYGPEVVFGTASSKTKPGLVRADMTPITDMDAQEFYGGCWARAKISVYAYDKAGNKGVSFGLRNIQKYKDDVAFSGATKPEDDFDAIPVPAGSAAESVAADPLFG